MESTGVYWKPVYHILGGVFEVTVANSYQVRNLPGRKTDKTDSEWLAELHAHGLIRPSFIPPPEIRALRDLTRTRVKLVQDRANYKNRVHKILEDANIKLGNVARDVFGVSGRAMLEALVGGERDGRALAQLARGTMRRKLPELELALSGTFTEHHALLARMLLQLIDALSGQVKVLDCRIGELMEQHARPIELLASIPGMSETSARDVIAEVGLDMARFGSDKRLASWASLCPGNNESAGKRLRGKSRHGNKYLKRVLTECAWTARNTTSFLGRTFRRLETRIGGKKAAIAVAHKILVVAYHVLSQGVPYDEARYDIPSPAKEEASKERALKALERLGFSVTLVPQAT
jgi:transposase